MTTTWNYNGSFTSKWKSRLHIEIYTVDVCVAWQFSAQNVLLACRFQIQPRSLRSLSHNSLCKIRNHFCLLSYVLITGQTVFSRLKYLPVYERGNLKTNLKGWASSGYLTLLLMRQLRLEDISFVHHYASLFMNSKSQLEIVAQ